MAEPYLGEIRMFAFNFAPQGWAFCNGQVLSISQNTALFSLLGTTYGGNGQTTFSLPNLQSRVPLAMGTGAGLTTFTLGTAAGTESVALNVSQMPAHSHTVTASGQGAANEGPGTKLLAITATNEPIYLAGATAPLVTMDPRMINVTGAGAPHTNLQPYLVLNFCIALQGIYPTMN